MSGKVIWTQRAEDDFDNIVGYLSQNWTSKEILKFTDKVKGDTMMLISYPEMGKATKRKPFADLLFQNKHQFIIK